MQKQRICLYVYHVCTCLMYFIICKLYVSTSIPLMIKPVKHDRDCEQSFKEFDIKQYRNKEFASTYMYLLGVFYYM